VGPALAMRKGYADPVAWGYRGRCVKNGGAPNRALRRGEE